jgi:NADPH:quinone reductase-like Zn-dependent oxidoreductase
MTAKVPSQIPLHEAAVLPLAVSTATHGLYMHLNLPVPPASASDAPSPGSDGVLAIWGGSSSVGAVAIQLAVASGLKVVTTASARNHAFVKELGASVVIDHSSGDAVQQVVTAVKDLGGQFKGVYDAIGDAMLAKSIEVVEAMGGGVVSTVLPGSESKSTDNVKVFGGELRPNHLFYLRRCFTTLCGI